MNREVNLFVAGLSSLLIIGVANASEIYHWVDDYGVTHFSDTPPEGGVAARAIPIDAANPPDYDPTTDPYSIANQARRISEKWSALTEAKDRRRDEAANRVAPNDNPRQYEGWRYRYWPGYRAPARPPAHQFRTIRLQADALDSLQLTGSRPYSINSSAHQARVERSRSFPEAAARPLRRPSAPWD